MKILSLGYYLLDKRVATFLITVVQLSTRIQVFCPLNCIPVHFFIFLNLRFHVQLYGECFSWYNNSILFSTRFSQVMYPR